MGTWGAGLLDNDTAMDLVGDIGDILKVPLMRRLRVFVFLHKTLSTYLDAPRVMSPEAKAYLLAEIACPFEWSDRQIARQLGPRPPTAPHQFTEMEACAASLIVAEIAEDRANPDIECLAKLTKILKRHSQLPELIEMSIRVTEGIGSETSETSLTWAEPWVDPKNRENWHKAMDELHARLVQLLDRA